MADPDPNTPQVVDPERVVDLTRLLQIRGPLGVLNVLDTIVPVVNMGDVVQRTVTVLQPAFRSTDIFSQGVLTAPAANTVLADTGPLAEGVYDLLIMAATTGTTSPLQGVRFQHRDAANAADLAVWFFILNRPTGGSNASLAPYSMGYEVAANERIRAINPVVISAGDSIVVTIMARRR